MFKQTSKRTIALSSFIALCIYFNLMWYVFFFSLFACYLLLRSPSFQFAWVLLVILLCCCCCCFFHCFSFVFDINAQLLYTEVFACIFCILDHKHMQLQMTHEDANSIKKKLKWIKKKKKCTRIVNAVNICLTTCIHQPSFAFEVLYYLLNL